MRIGESCGALCSQGKKNVEMHNKGSGFEGYTEFTGLQLDVPNVW